MSNKADKSLPGDPVPENLEASERREFLITLGKWSKAVIGGVLLGGSLMVEQEAHAHGRDGWSGSGGIWYNSGNGWGGWIQRPWGWNDGPRWRDHPHWYDRPYWSNRPYWNDGWHNRHPWHNGGWHNQGWHNGGGWHNRGWYNR